MDLYYPPNARSEDQRTKMERLERDAICIFCPEHLGADCEGRSILHQMGGWSLVKNMYPYLGTLHHYLLVPDEHVSAMTDLPPDRRLGYWDILQYAIDRFGLSYYGRGGRNGDPSLTGGTIYHVHEHLVVGDPDMADVNSVKLYLSSSPINRPSQR
jgi:diadenosine tetraphosphate (Ap4A) HIT family hydrolase